MEREMEILDRLAACEATIRELTANQQKLMRLVDSLEAHMRVLNDRLG